MNARPKKVHDRKAKGEKATRGKTTTKLLVAMTGKASAAKAAEGDEPVFAYIASLPPQQRENRRAHRCPGGQDVAGAPRRSSRNRL
jgi:hypothetical protein